MILLHEHASGCKEKSILSQKKVDDSLMLGKKSSKNVKNYAR